MWKFPMAFLRPVSLRQENIRTFPLRGIICAALLLLGGGGRIFGFEFEFNEGRTAGGLYFPFSTLSLGGEASAQFRLFFEDLEDPEPLAALGESNKLDFLTGKLKFSALGSAADVVVNLSLSPFQMVFDYPAWPVAIDEAYLRLYFGSLHLEGGLRKLTWGKADTQGPLDVINPLDYTDFTILTDQEARKLARPLFHLSYYTGDYSKIEAVLAPSFQGNRYAETGPWVPRQMEDFARELEPVLAQRIYALYLSPQEPPNLDKNVFGDPSTVEDKIRNHYRGLSLDDISPVTNSIEYFQAGLRFTGTLGPVDFGFQYFYGNLFRPAFTASGLAGFYQEPYRVVRAVYNRYHQIGADYAQVLWGFNLRAEAAVNLSSDLDGRDGEVYNPFLGWALGFDRDLFWGINLNLQGVGTVRLFQSRLGTSVLEDIEAGSSLSSSRLIALLSKTFVRDTVEIRALGLWGIEDRDFLFNPSLVWLPLDEFRIEFSGGLFLGNERGELGQYRKRNFLKLKLTYSF
jgi:hypothetical protein